MSTPPVFAGSLPDDYDEFLVPLVFARWAELVAQRAAALSPRDVLELAAGTGAVTRALRTRLPSARITATDLSPDMLARIRRAGRVDGVRLVVADAQALPFASGAADAVVFCFGVMFVRDRARAYAEVRRVLRPGGTLLMTVWDGLDRNPHVGTILRNVAELAPDDPPDGLRRLAHGHHDPSLIRAELGSAGFERITVEAHDRSVTTTSAATARAYVRGSLLARELPARGLDAGTVERRVRTALADQFGAGDVEWSAAALLMEAE